jgi:hypothetical protein
MHIYFLFHGKDFIVQLAQCILASSASIRGDIEKIKGKIANLF